MGWGAAGKLPSKAVTFSLPGKPAEHRFRGRSRGAQPGIAREVVLGRTPSLTADRAPIGLAISSLIGFTCPSYPVGYS